MKLSQAIELLPDLYKIPDTQLDPDYLDAILLGKEAAEAILKLRRGTYPLNLSCLPSETPPHQPSSPPPPFYQHLIAKGANP